MERREHRAFIGSVIIIPKNQAYTTVPLTEEILLTSDSIGKDLMAS